MGYYPIVSSYTRSIAMCIKYSKDVKKLIPEGRWTPKQMDEAASTSASSCRKSPPLQKPRYSWSSRTRRILL